MGTWGGREAQALSVQVMAIYGWRCWLCHEMITPGDQSVDHKLPRSKGGSNHMSNLRPAHRHCNYSRGNKMLDDPHIKLVDNLGFFD